MTDIGADPHGTERPDLWRAAPWGLTDVLGVLGLTAILTSALAAVVVRLAGLEGTPSALRGVLLPLPLVLLAAVTAAWVARRFGSAGRLFGLAPGGWMDLLRGLGVGTLAFFGINIGLGLIVQGIARAAGAELPVPQERLREFAADPALLVWLFVTAVAIAPVCEELFFRGMLLQALRRRVGRGWGIVLSAMIFSLAHLVAEPTGRAGLLVFSLILPMGLLLGWSFERHRRLAVPIAVHATFNLYTTLALLAGMAALPPQ